MNIVMPKLGLTMTEATLTRWHKAAGEAVVQGEILFEFESDKSIMEYEAPADGVLAEIQVAEGETVRCGAPVAVLETGTSSRPRPQAGAPPAAAGAALQPDPAPQPAGRTGIPVSAVIATPAAKRMARGLEVELTAVSGRGPQGRIQLVDVEEAARTAPPAGSPVSPAITPVARRVASALGVDWTQLSGSGASGRVVKEDVLAATPETAAPEPEVATTRTLPLAGVREVIARRMSESAFTAPHVTLFTEADATSLVEARAQLNAELAGQIKISYNALLIAIVARLLREQPDLNAYVAGDEIHYYDRINIALAVDTERGLLAPVIRDADQMDLVAIQRTGDELIQRALDGRSSPDDLTGGTFTITNLGMFDIDGFTPIINQPQAAILGIGRIAPRPVAGGEGDRIEIRQMVTLSLSFDHRLVDGGPAARFLQRVKQLIERPFALAVPSAAR